MCLHHFVLSAKNKSVPVAPHFYQHLTLSAFGILAIRIDVWLYLTVVLTRSSLMSYNVLLGLKDRDGQKAFSRSITACHVPGNVLLCSSNEIASSTAAAVGFITWLSS